MTESPVNPIFPDLAARSSCPLASSNDDLRARTPTYAIDMLCRSTSPGMMVDVDVVS